jgi:HK97 gp10 family phage protein
MENFQVMGDKILESQLSALPEKVRAAVEKKAIRAVNRIVIKAMRDNVPRDTGALRRSITSVVRTYQGGKVILGIVGPDYNFSGYAVNSAKGKKKFSRGARDNRGGQKFKRPANYVHLVVGGTKKRETKAGGNRGFVTANPFIARVAAQVQQEVSQAFADALREALK